MTKTQTQLPGQSRSVACPTRSCRRLAGHKGEHRTTLTKSATTSTVRPEVLAAIEDVERKVAKALGPKGRKNAKRPKVVVLPMAEYRRLVAGTEQRVRRPKASPRTSHPESTTPNRVIRAKLAS